MESVNGDRVKAGLLGDGAPKGVETFAVDVGLRVTVGPVRASDTGDVEILVLNNVTNGILDSGGVLGLQGFIGFAGLDGVKSVGRAT